MVVLRGKVHLFTKNWIGRHTVHYTLPTEAGEYQAQRIDSLHTINYKITGAASGANDLILLTGYTNTGQCALVLVFGFNDSERYFQDGNARFFRLGSAKTLGQLESVCFVNPTRGFLASEKFNPLFLNVRQQAFRFQSSEWIIPFLQSRQPPANVQGNIRFNSQSGQLEMHNGTQWLVANN